MWSDKFDKAPHVVSGFMESMVLFETLNDTTQQNISEQEKS